MLPELWDLLGQGSKGRLELEIPSDMETAPFPGWLYLVGRLLAWASRGDGEQDWKDRRKRLDRTFGKMTHRASGNAACWPYVAEFFAVQLFNGGGVGSLRQVEATLNGWTGTVYQTWFPDGSARMAKAEFQSITVAWYQLLDNVKDWISNWKHTSYEICGRWSRAIHEAGYRGAAQRLDIPEYDPDHTVEDGEILADILCSMMHEWNYGESHAVPDARRLCGMQASGRLLIGWVVASGPPTQGSFLVQVTTKINQLRTEIAPRRRLPPPVERIGDHQSELVAFLVDHVSLQMPRGRTAAFRVSNADLSPANLPSKELKISGIQALARRLEGGLLQVELERGTERVDANTARLAIALLATVKDSPTHYLDPYNDIKREYVYPALERWEQDFLGQNDSENYGLYDNSYPPSCNSLWTRKQVAEFVMQNLLDSEFSEKDLLEIYYFWPIGQGTFKQNQPALKRLVGVNRILERMLGPKVDLPALLNQAEIQPSVADKLYGACSLIATLIGLIDELGPKRPVLEQRCGHRRKERVMLVPLDEEDRERFAGQQSFLQDEEPTEE